MNLETTPLLSTETKTFDKFGFTITYGIARERHKLWVKVFRDPQNNIWTEENINAVTDSSQMPQLTVNWEDSKDYVHNAYVAFARFTDQEYGLQNLPIEVWAAPEGLLLGIVETHKADDEFWSMLDPCVIIYDGKSRINLQPIFNVARSLRIRKETVRSIMPPSEILLAMYPGFVIQNRMSQYQLKPKMPLVVSPELTNDAAEIAKH